MECVGTKVEDDNMVHIQAEHVAGFVINCVQQMQADGEPLGAWLDEHFISSYEFPKDPASTCR